MHASDDEWSRWGVEPLSLMDLLQTVDAVVVLLPSYERFRGVLSARVLPTRAWTRSALSPSMLFDASHGRGPEPWRRSPHLVRQRSTRPGWTGRPLARRRRACVTDRQANQTRGGMDATRAAWAIARRVDEVLSRDVPAVRAAGQRSR